MTNPYRAMCAELVNELTRAANGLSNRTALAAHINDNHRALWAKDAYQAAARARALLDQPVAEGLTDAAAWDLADDLGIIRGDSGDLHVSFADLGPFARAALALCTNPTPHD
jgi:hypothetical protein